MPARVVAPFFPRSQSAKWTWLLVKPVRSERNVLSASNRLDAPQKEPRVPLTGEMPFPLILVSMRAEAGNAVLAIA